MAKYVVNCIVGSALGVSKVVEADSPSEAEKEARRFIEYTHPGKSIRIREIKKLS